MDDEDSIDLHNIDHADLAEFYFTSQQEIVKLLLWAVTAAVLHILQDLISDDSKFRRTINPWYDSK